MDFGIQKAIAAGLSIKVLCSFEPQHHIDNDYHDELYVLSDEQFS